MPGQNLGLHKIFEPRPQRDTQGGGEFPDVRPPFRPSLRLSIHPSVPTPGDPQGPKSALMGLIFALQAMK